MLRIYIAVAYQSQALNGTANGCLIHWILASAGGVKLNTDGVIMSPTTRRDLGGHSEYDQGGWILGFFGKTNCESSLEVER